LLNYFNQGPSREIDSNGKYPFFVYDETDILTWSDNQFVPSQASVADTFKLKLLKAGNGDYLARKWKINDTQFLISIIPLHRKFNITNNYLDTWWNENIFSSGNISILEPDASIGTAVCVLGQCPFKVSFLAKDLPLHESTRLISLIFLSVSLILFTVFVYNQLKKIRYPEISFVILYAFFYFVRITMVNLNFPNVLYPSDLFNPQIFASSPLNASLGDLMLNEIALLILCFYLFRNYQRFKIFQYLYSRDWKSWLLSVFAGVCILFSILFPFVVIQTIYNNSGIVLDISQSLDFNSIRVVATIVVLLSGVCSFLFAHTFIRLLIADGRRLRVIVSFFVSMILYLLINAITRQEYLSSLVLGTAYFLLIY
ncbi:MAG: hypothetical protein C0490_27515, partial [Marivirga sp.]|nr:hypothetical protein [Marivirga sp.]